YAERGHVLMQNHQLPQLVIGNVSRDAVGAEEKLSTVLNLHDFHIYFNAILGTECATDDVLAGMIGGLLSRHAPSAHFFFDNRMIFRFARQMSVGSQTIQTRI